MSAGASAVHAEIRRATVADAARVARLWAALTREHAQHDPYFRLRRDAAPAIDALVAAILRDRDSLVLLPCDGEGAPAGDAVCIARVDQAPPILEESGRVEITDLYVATALRRRGLGRALATHALAWAADKGISRVEVRVASRNAEGQAFWRALGFGEFVDVLQRRL